MPRLLIRCILFFSSYFPLMSIFSIFLWRKHLHSALGILGFGIFCLLVMALYFFRQLRRGGVSQTKITEVQRRDENVMAYIASYLIPFVTFPLDSLEQTLALLVFIGVLLIVYVNSNMVYINPMLNLVGYHLYEITIETDKMSRYLITCQSVKPDRTLYFVEIGDHICLEKRMKIP